MNAAEVRVLRALRSGPIYRPLLNVILGGTEAEVSKPLLQLVNAGHVEVARDIGPHSYRITESGIAALRAEE